jgi:hypothetical protein
MGRLNLTLPPDTLRALTASARQAGKPVAAHARGLLAEALARHRRAERERAWVAAYRADHVDARKLLDDLEPGALELLGDEDT